MKGTYTECDNCKARAEDKESKSEFISIFVSGEGLDYCSLECANEDLTPRTDGNFKLERT